MPSSPYWLGNLGIGAYSLSSLDTIPRLTSLRLRPNGTFPWWNTLADVQKLPAGQMYAERKYAAQVMLIPREVRYGGLARPPFLKPWLEAYEPVRTLTEPLFIWGSCGMLHVLGNGKGLIMQEPKYAEIWGAGDQWFYCPYEDSDTGGSDASEGPYPTESAAREAAMSLGYIIW